MKKIFSRSIIILMVITIFTTSIGQNVNLAYANTTINDSKICVESPTNSQLAKGIAKIEGYVLSDFDPSTLNFMNCNIYVDGNLETDTLFKLKTAIQRDDLKKLYPSYIYAGTGGFSYELDTAKLTNGNHKIKLNFNGIEKNIDINVYNNPSLVNVESSTMENVKGIIDIKGYILSDFSSSTFNFMNCNVFIDGINQNDTLWNLTTAMERKDLKDKYPKYEYAGNSGFSYKLDTTKLTNGNHTVKFDFNGIEKEIVIKVFNNRTIINIESTAVEKVKGIIDIKGYILSELIPSSFKCNIYIDGEKPKDMYLNLKTAQQREDLKEKYPEYQYAGDGGFSYKLDTTKLTNGNHNVKFDFNGIEKEIEINVFNNPTIINIESTTEEKLKGTVDIKGYILSELIPSNCNLYIDGEKQNEMYNLKTAIERDDLKEKYPEYQYAENSGFSYKLDTTTLTNGIHKLKFDFNGIEKVITISVENIEDAINIETSKSMEKVSGTVLINGNILSNLDIFNSEFVGSVYLDGEQDFRGVSIKPINSDNIKKHPEYKNEGGFSYDIDTTKINNGNHTITFNFNGIKKEIEINVNNENAPQ